MLGNAPTRILVCADATLTKKKRRNETEATESRLVMPFASGNHRQHSQFRLSSITPAIPVSGTGLVLRAPTDQVGQCCIFENFGGCVAHFQKHFVERAMVGVAID